MKQSPDSQARIKENIEITESSTYYGTYDDGLPSTLIIIFDSLEKKEIQNFCNNNINI